MSKPSPPSFFPTYALDQAFCGIGAGLVSTLFMHPLDLLKVKLQVQTTNLKGWRTLWGPLREVVRTEGRRGLYRGLNVNLVGNASSWGLYFLWYTMLKARMVGGEGGKLSAGQHLLASAESGVLTAIITNPLWVVKTRMFTTSSSSPKSYRSVTGSLLFLILPHNFSTNNPSRHPDGLVRLTTEEGVRGLSKGMLLALIGVSNGAIQFMTYEELKRWRFDVRRKKLGVGASDADVRKLSNLEYILMSGSAKLVAIGITYPYQVIRSRIQYQPPTIPPYTSIPNCISRTFASEGLRGFYKGLGTNALRILPGTCVTFVVYEQLSRLLEGAARSEVKESRID